MTSNKSYFWSDCYLETINEEYRCLPQHIFQNFKNMKPIIYLETSNYYYKRCSNYAFMIQIKTDPIYIVDNFYDVYAIVNTLHALGELSAISKNI